MCHKYSVIAIAFVFFPGYSNLCFVDGYKNTWHLRFNSWTSPDSVWGRGQFANSNLQSVQRVWLSGMTIWDGSFIQVCGEHSHYFPTVFSVICRPRGPWFCGKRVGLLSTHSFDSFCRPQAYEGDPRYGSGFRGIGFYFLFQSRTGPDHAIGWLASPFTVRYFHIRTLGHEGPVA